MRSIVVGVVGVMVSACGFPPEPKSPEQVPLVAAPTALTAKPLKAGQWVLYREHVGTRDAGLVLLAAMNEAPCGMWFAAALRGPDTTRSWQFCIAADGTIAKASLDGSRVDPAIHAAELEPLRTRVLPPRIAGRFVVEEAHVPAGHFAGALRIDGASTTWLHPEVPLGAVVQVRAGDREDTLLAYGDDVQDASIPTGSAGVHVSLPKFLEVALGGGYLSGAGATESDQLDTYALTAGIMVSRTSDIVVSTAIADSSRFVPSKDMADKSLAVTFGLRISPFRAQGRGLLGGLYLQATTGYARLERPMDVVGNGLELAPALGWQLVHGPGWGLAVEARDQLAIFNGNVGFHQVAEVFATIQLWMPMKIQP